MTLEELMTEYEGLFDDLFPLYCCQGMDEGDIMQEIRRCIEQGEPFEEMEGVDY